MFDWDDVRYFLAVARHGSTLAAAKALRVSQSTVHRRLEELERRIGRQLVRRHPTGYRLAELGQKLRAHAERIEDAVIAFERQLAASAGELTGTVRVACPESLGYRLMRSPLLDKLNASFPSLSIEFVMSDDLADLASGQADIAMRTAAPTDQNLFGRKISDSYYAVYASRSYIERHGRPERLEDINDHAVVSCDDSLVDHATARWLGSVAPQARIAARGRSLPSQLLAAKSGAGLALLPLGVGECENELVRVLGPLSDVNRPFYLLMHEDLRRTPRVRAVFDFIIGELDMIRPMLGGDIRPDPQAPIGKVVRQD
ncbi:MAG: LysR family transcriptional regulator [Rhizobiales bacterium]|nr:LysR family transcriptional regulator [Hyphomicrobiales bacterium]